MRWRDRAECRTEDPELFFPIGRKTPAAQAQAAKAKAVCARCPVKAECLEYAFDAGLDHGVFGGLDEDQRRALKRKQVAA